MRLSAAVRLLFAASLIAVLGCGYLLRARIADGFTYTGSDSYIYMGTALELREHHRYAVRLPPWSAGYRAVPPLSHGRPPGYALFLSAFANPNRAPAADAYTPFFTPVKLAQRLFDLGTCLLTLAIAHRLGGPVAAWTALSLAVLHPVLWLYAASIMTETLAVFLTSLALLLGLVAVDAQTSSRRAFFWLGIGGAVTGLLTLVRADGILLLPCLSLSALSRPSWSAKHRLCAWGLVLCAWGLVFSPWPGRNQLRFGSPYAFDAVSDTRGQPIAHTHFMDWFATWIEKEEHLPDTLWCVLRPECIPDISRYPSVAFDSEDERRTIADLYRKQRREGFTKAVDAGFAELAKKRIRQHPLQTLLRTPLLRAKHLWCSANDLPLRTANQPWPALMDNIRHRLSTLNTALCALALCGLVLLCTGPRRRPRRRMAAIVLVALIIRTGFFTLAGMVESRYMLELLPLTLALCGVALAAIARRGSPVPDPALKADKEDSAK